MIKRRALISTVFICLVSASFAGKTFSQSNISGSVISEPGLSGLNSGTGLGNLNKGSIPLSEPDNEEARWIPASFNPFPSHYLSLPGFSDTEKEILSQNYFVVINDNRIKSFSQLYKENRLDNVSSLITADSLAHALLAFQNNIRLKVIEKVLCPALESLLLPMVRNHELDYGATEDADVKEEIKYNLAFLTVAIKLLVPDFPLPGNPGVRKLVTSELENIKKGKLGFSVIFHRVDDFSDYVPSGFYKANAVASRFFSAYQWMAKSYLEMSDTNSDTAVGNGNEFRRAILLFKGLMKTKVQVSNPQRMEEGINIWKRLNKTVQDLNIASGSTAERDTHLLPENLAAALKSATASEVSVSAMSNPLNRARLLITIRSNAPRQIGSASIFSLSRKGSSKEKQLRFHVFSPLYTPDDDLRLSVLPSSTNSDIKFNSLPAGLLLLHRNDVKWSDKVLSKNSAKLDEKLIEQLNSNANGIAASNDSAFWQIFHNWSNPMPTQTQLFFQTENWRTYCLERQVAAWVDNFTATKANLRAVPLAKANARSGNADAADTARKNAGESNTGKSISTAIRKFGINSWRTAGNFNYVEPNVDLFNKLAASQSNLENALKNDNIFPDEYVEESRDFIRLLKRLASIARAELNLDFPNLEDQALLGSIDKLLSVIESPLPSRLFVASTAVRAKTEPENGSNTGITGVNMETGYPSIVYAVIQYKRAYYLLRGAGYSYFEENGEEINAKHWQRQLEFGFLEIPFWCQSFQRTKVNDN